MKIGSQIFDALKQMDREAGRLSDGWETGLRGYAAHTAGTYKTKRNSYEDSFTDRLAELLRAKGYDCKVRPRYLIGNLISDLCVTGDEFGAMWIEVKGSWRNTIPDGDHDCKRALPNKSYLKHLEAAAKDVRKLKDYLRPGDATHAGLLLVCFDVANHPTLTIAESDFRALRDSMIGWTEESAEWPDSAWAGGRILCRFWWTEVTKAMWLTKVNKPTVSS